MSDIGSESVRSRLRTLKWLATVVPAIAVFLYETVRHDLLEHVLPENFGNVITGLVALVLAYLFSEAIFRSVNNIQDEAVRESRDAAALAAAVKERENLSRDLHDGLAQLVSFLMLRVDTIVTLIKSGKDAAAVDELEELRGSASDLYLDIRESIASLRSRVVERGLVLAVKDYLDEFEDQHDLETDFQVDFSKMELPPTIALQVFGIIREALTNVRRHSGAQKVTLTLTASENRSLGVEVMDDGRGFDLTEALSRPGAYGLQGMRERAQGLGGTWHIDTAPGAGSRVCVRVPLEPRAGLKK